MCTRATSGHRCGSRPTRAGSISPRPGSPGSRTQPALELIEQIGVDRIHAHDLALANRFRAGIGLEPGDSAIVCAELQGADERLREANIIAAVRGGRLRTSWHVYNTEADVDRVLDVVTDEAAGSRINVGTNR